MSIVAFPPIGDADEHGLLAVGGDLEPDSLLLAYRSGIFPWPLDEHILAWFAPPQRALLFFDRIHIAKSLQKERRRKEFTFAFNRNFEAVVAQCAEMKNRGAQQGTWITEGIQEAYIRLHQLGYCHSIETYHDGELVGGLYGVSIGSMFAGESMFYRRPNASKLALLHLCDYLQSRGATWLDCQVMTPHLKQFGAIEVPRDEYMNLLRTAIRKKMRLFGP